MNTSKLFYHVMYLLLLRNRFTNIFYFRKRDDSYFGTGFVSQVPLSCNQDHKKRKDSLETRAKPAVFSL